MSVAAVLCPACGTRCDVPRDDKSARVACPKCAKQWSIAEAPSSPAADVTNAATLDFSGPQDESRAESPRGGGDSDEDSFRFLRPAEKPDELGRLGHFRVLKELGRGGMGMVFLAEDVRLLRPVALKVMLPNHAAKAQAKLRFLREARIAAGIDNDHIIAIHEVDEDNGVPYLTMPVLRGEALSDRLKREKRLPLPEVLRIGSEICSGLQAAHDRQLVHRDLKPANLWLEGTRGRVKILDFGLARNSDEEQHLTASGVVLGTPAYMAPEQARSSHVDLRADLFSLGTILYQLVTGRLPFRGHDTMSLLYAICTDEPAPPAELSPNVPDEMNRMILKLLAKNPNARFASAEETGLAIEAIRTQHFAGLTISQHGRSGDDRTSPIASTPVAVRTKQPMSLTTYSAIDPAPTTLPSPPRRNRPWVGIVAGAAGFFLLSIVAYQIVIRIRDRDGNETKIEVAKGADLKIEKDGKPIPIPGLDKSNGAAKTNPSASPLMQGEAADIEEDRRAVEFLHPHAYLTLRTPSGKDIYLEPKQPLPEGPYRFTDIRSIEPDSELSKRQILAVIGKVKVLEGIGDFYGRRMWDETDLREIAKLPFAPNFKRFSSYSTELTPAIIEALKAFPKFRNLTLPASRADDALLHALASDLPTLKHLALSYLTTTNDESRSVTTKGIAELSRMETLRLDVPDKETGKDWCRVIGGFRDLRDLALDRGDHGGLGEIAKVPDLNRLTLSFSPVALDDSAIANLSKMKMLRYLDLRTTPATAAQTKALAAALPKCWIIWDQGSIKP